MKHLSLPLPRQHIYKFSLISILMAVIVVQLIILAVKSTVNTVAIPNLPAIPATNDLSGSRLLALGKLWTRYVTEAGAEQAYTDFKTQYSPVSENVSHSAAHMLGEILYDTQGVAGVGVCDNTFAFGCYHGFFGKAVAAEGINVISELDKACIAKWGIKGTGCQHGIGHGIQTYYQDDKLVESLTACATLTWQEPIGGCTSGVFMEYNFKTMEMGQTNARTRKVTETNIHEPCDKVPEQFLQACYFEQPQWWQSAFKTDYKKIGSLCNSIKKISAREACYLGIGNSMSPTVEYDVDKTIANCKLIEQIEGQTLCRAGASWIIFANPKYSKDTDKLCDGLSEDYKHYCLQKSDVLNVGKI